MGQGYCILERMTKGPQRTSWRDAEAGCREPFLDAQLYDYEYRHRRADITFYRRLAKNRKEFAPGAILDLACGSGRLLVPLVRDGHAVIGVERSRPMLTAAARRIARLSEPRRKQCRLLEADMRNFRIRSKATLAISAFHSVQHLLTDADLRACLHATRAALTKGAWLAFDVLPPDSRWLGRDPSRRWGRTVFRHPGTKKRTVYTANHLYDAKSRLLHIKLYYQPITDDGRADGPEQVVRLCHRQLWPDDVIRLLRETGFRVVEVFADFDGRLLDEHPDGADEHVYVAVAV
jgi:SAM-dependent methyltransferase